MSLKSVEVVFYIEQVEILALKSTVIQMKNSVEVFKSRFDLVKEGISESEVNWDYPLWNKKEEEQEEEEEEKKNEQC